MINTSNMKMEIVFASINKYNAGEMGRYSMLY